MVTLSEFFPLTHMIQAAREIMINGASFMDVANHLSVMAVMTVVCLVVGAYSFRWDQD